ncbi:GNAT family N-acetyltransferase [Mycoplasmatota bacterium WC44]
MEIRIAKTPQEIIDNLKIREVVFIVGQNVPRDLELDGLDQEATLIIAYKDNKPVGAGRYRLLNGYAKIERIAVLSEYRGLGVGKMIMDFIEETIKENTTIEIVKLNSQCSAADFYEKLNYVKKGEVFMDAGIEHIQMIKAI